MRLYFYIWYQVWICKSSARTMYSAAINRVYCIWYLSVSPSTTFEVVTKRRFTVSPRILHSFPQHQQLSKWLVCGFGRSSGRPRENDINYFGNFDVRRVSHARTTLVCPYTTCYAIFSCKNQRRNQPKPLATVYWASLLFVSLYPTL